MNDFIFGTQYLRGLSPDKADWERDLGEISARGFNTIRVWLVWGVLEVREGEIDFPYIERILSLAEQKNLRTIFLFHLHGAPEWLIRDYPQYRYVNRAGQAFEPSARANTPSGGWPGLCPDHFEVREQEDRFIREVTTYIGDRAYAYEPVNEPHMWVDWAEGRNADYCYCEATREEFRCWLRRKYGTLEALSAAWGKRFDCWESVRPATWAYGYGDQVDFRMFTMENVARQMRRRAGVIRQHTRRPVIAHAWGGGSTCCPQLGAMAFDDWCNAAEAESWGCSGFPRDVEDTARLAQSMDATRSAANDKLFWQSELGGGVVGGGLDFRTPAAPELLALWCWESVFHGAKGLLFWQFRTELFGNESGYYSLTGRAGEPTGRLLAAECFGKAIAAYEQEFMSARVPDAEVAILFSPRSWLLDWTIHRNNKFSCDAMAGYYDAFYHANVPVDILHEMQLSPERLRQYKLVIVPAGLSLTDDAGEALCGYVRDGGNVLADPFTASWDGAVKLSSIMPGAGLHKLFGVKEKEFRTGDGKMMTIGKYTFCAAFPWEVWQQESCDARPFAVTEEGEWVIAEHRCGKGHGFLSGMALGNLNAAGNLIGDDFRSESRREHRGDAASLILDIAAECGVVTEFQVPLPLHLRRLLLPDGELLLLANHSGEPFEGEVGIPSGRAIYGGEALSGQSGISLPPYGNAVLLIRKTGRPSFSGAACGILLEDDEGV